MPDNYVPFEETLAHAEPWPEIDPSLLEDRRVEVPAFPLQHLPLSWERWVADTAQSAGTAVDYVAQALLAAVAAVCGAGVSVRVTPSWHEPLVLWQALVGTPSSGKSPALAAVRRQLDRIEHERREGDADRRAHHALETEQGQGGGCFVPTQVVVADATMEALADVVSGNPRGVVLWRDELSAWLANLNRYANGGSDRAHWLEAWAAAGVTINRRSRSVPLHLPMFPVSIVGTIQPDRIAEALQGGDDGMAARFLYGWPAIPDYLPLLDRRTPRDDDALVMLQKIARVAGTPDAPLAMNFDGEALMLFDRFGAELHAHARAADGLEAGWLGKGAGTVARLAAVLALLHWSEQDGDLAPLGTIGREPAMHAIALWSGYFRKHAAAVFNQAGRTDRDREARRVLRWIQTNAVEEVSRENVRRNALCHAVDADGADRVITRLEQGGVLRVLPLPKGRGRPARRWAVNPGVVG
jgi:hypothetical protein